ncbi:hypothetical protein HAX54_007521 [Datura stramonium]|uniref:Uncharacterized protein n=1 Tax=Datura stramonium TaxID=4076 RepID=A0ABS8TC37_DATST|nr:hypothetical protein [Datura stramonium]
MVYLPSEGVTVPDQKRNKIRFTESRGQKKVCFVGDKPRATGQIQVERAWKGSGKPVRGFRGSGSTGSQPVKASARVTRHFNFSFDPMIIGEVKHYNFSELQAITYSKTDLLAWLHEKRIATGSVTVTCIMMDGMSLNPWSSS